MRSASKIPPYRAGFFMVGAGRNFAADALDIGQTRRLVAPSGAERIRKAPLNAALSIVFGEADLWTVISKKHPQAKRRRIW